MDMDTGKLLDRLRPMLPRGSFLVGGAVRDQLTGQEPKDFDFLVPGDSMRAAQELAKRLDGFFVPLDTERQIARVVLRGGFDLDLQPIPPGGVEASLAERDFAMNAIAQSMDDGRLADPHGGRADIAARRIRMVAEKNLDEDPLRVLRAWRFHATLGFSIDDALAAALKTRYPKIWSVAPERIAEEWFLMLNTPGAGGVLGVMAKCGALTGIFPQLAPMMGCAQNEFHHLDVFDHSIAAAVVIDAIAHEPEKFLPERTVPVVADYLARPLIGRRTRAAYLRFACLLHDIEKPSTREADAEGYIHFYGHEKKGGETTKGICEKLRLARAETDLVTDLVGQHMIFGPGIYGPDANLERFFYRMYRDFGGDDGIGLLLLSLADRMASCGPALPADFNEKHRRFVGDGILRYIEQKERVVPPKLISGEDVIRALKIPAGREIGAILERVRELQAEGRITSREDALNILPTLRGPY